MVRATYFRSSRLTAGKDSLVIFWKTITILLIFMTVVPVVQSQDPQMGDQVCAGGYIMDTFCIERGTLFDNPSVRTLEEPNKHSVHCLVDVGVCEGSPFEILMDPPSGSEVYMRWFRVSDNTLLTDLARSLGSCSTCTGEGNQAQGFRAQVIGTVTQARMGEIPPVIDITEVESLSAEEISCDGVYITNATTMTPVIGTPPDTAIAPTVIEDENSGAIAPLFTCIEWIFCYIIASSLLLL